MVEQTRRPRHVVSLQAGPGEVNSVPHSSDTVLSLRINDRAAQIFGHRLAVIGDQLDKDWAGRRSNWLPTGLHALRPAHALTSIIYWDIQTHVWGFRGLTAAVKAWIAGTSPGKGILKAHAWAAWMSGGKLESCPGWTRGVLATVALAASATVLMHYGWTVTASEP